MNNFYRSNSMRRQESNTSSFPFPSFMKANPSQKRHLPPQPPQQAPQMKYTSRINSFYNFKAGLISDKYAKPRDMILRPKSVEQEALNRLRKQYESMDQQNNIKMIEYKPQVENPKFIQNKEINLKPIKHSDKENQNVNLQVDLKQKINAPKATKQKAMAIEEKKDNDEYEEFFDYFYQKYLGENPTKKPSHQGSTIKQSTKKREEQKQESEEEEEEEKVENIPQTKDANQSIQDVQLSYIQRIEEFKKLTREAEDDLFDLENDISAIQEEEVEKRLQVQIKKEEQIQNRKKRGLTQKEREEAKSFIKDSYLEDSVRKANKNAIQDLSIVNNDEIQTIIDRMCVYNKLKNKIDKKINEQQVKQLEYEDQNKKKKFNQMQKSLKEELKLKSETLKKQKENKSKTQQMLEEINEKRKQELKQLQIKKRKIDEKARQQQALNARHQNRKSFNQSHHMSVRSEPVNLNFRKKAQASITNQNQGIVTQESIVSDLQSNYQEEQTLRLPSIQNENQTEYQDTMINDFIESKFEGQYQAQQYIEQQPGPNNQLVLYEAPSSQNLEVDIQEYSRLEELDEAQKYTIQELEFYSKEQELLNEKLKEQEMLLKQVMADIEKREKLINYVYKEGKNGKPPKR